MKKIFLTISFLFCTVFAFSFELQARFLPEFKLITNSIFKPGFTGTLGLDFIPWHPRGKDSVYFTVQGSYEFLNPSSDLKSFNSIDGSLGLGYDFRINDRFSVGAEILGGIFSVPSSESNVYGEMNGISYGGRLMADFRILPYLTIGASAGYKMFNGGKGAVNVIDGVGIGINLKFNLTKGLYSRTDLVSNGYEVSPLFPVFYSWYDENKFGTIHFINNEKNQIKNVTVSVFVEEFMANEDVCAVFDSIGMGEEFSVDLTAFLNESMLNTIMAHRTDGKVIVTYSNLGAATRFEQNIELNTLSRNNMSWEEDERAAAFISGNDASAKKFSRFVQIALKKNLNKTEPINVQYARGVFAALKTFGVNYVVDPASAFTDNVGSAAIDFLQFPYQTILYHGGDCDDLTILNCSLMESLGVETAMITVPGHIFMAFESGYSVDDVSKITDNCYIVKDEKVWIPVEITLCQDDFKLAKSTGMMEWNKAGDEAVLIPVHKAWEKYKPVSIPDSDVEFELPEIEKVLKNLQ